MAVGNIWGATGGKWTKKVLPEFLYTVDKVIACAPQRELALLPQVIVLRGFPSKLDAPHDEDSSNDRHGGDEGTCRGV